MLKQRCILCREPSDSHSLYGEAHVFWTACPGCGDYAFTSFAREEIEKLALDSPGRLNLIAETYSVLPPEQQLFPLLWKSRKESADFPNALKTVRDVEDYISAPIPHSRKPDEILRLIATKLLNRYRPFMGADHSSRSASWGCLLFCALPVQFGESPLNLIDSRNDWSGSERGSRKVGVPARAWREDGRHVPDDCLLSSGRSGFPATCIAERVGLRRQNEVLVPVLRCP